MLKSKIIDLIKQKGPMDLSEYMDLCNQHYYGSRDPFGVQGDFITAPEVSQMFGELVGAMIADYWIKIGSPDPFMILECGPGRGTLMSDLLRSTKSVNGLHEVVQVVLLETSPVLKELQQKKLEVFNPNHISALSDLNVNCPIFVIGNEFLDALPIEQFQFQENAWKKKHITLKDENLRFELLDTDYVYEGTQAPKENDILEVAGVASNFVKELSSLVQQNNGLALFIDYGHSTHAFGDTFQAVHGHKYTNPLENPGEADLTVHVDFESVKKVMVESGLVSCGPITQSEFLNNLGLQVRADHLKLQASDRQRQDIDDAVHRLTGQDQMGLLFKVICGVQHGGQRPAGF